MKVVIDGEKCTGHGRCYTLAPDVFRDDDEGYGLVIIEGDVPAGLVAPAETAIRNCPEQAITTTA